MIAGMRNSLVPALIIALGTTVLPLAGCKVVSNDQRASTSSSSTAQAAFDVAAYVDGVWDKKLLPFFETKSGDAQKVIEAIKKDLDEAGKQYGNRSDAEGSPWSFAVRAKGKVVSVNTESRAGTLVVEIASGAAKQEVTLQIGPVVKGSAIRDSLPFFSFTDVTNQIEYAQVGRAFNERAMKSLADVLPKLTPAGASIEFFGAISMTSVPETFVVTPVAIKVLDGGAS